MRDLGHCHFCQNARAVHLDHVVAKTHFKTHRNLAALLGFGPDDSINLVPACFNCNIRKSALRRVPPSMADRVELLNALMGGRPWSVWNGDPKELYA